MHLKVQAIHAKDQAFPYLQLGVLGELISHIALEVVKLTASQQSYDWQSP